MITDVTYVTGTLESPGAPKTSYGTIGDYAVVAITTLNTMWYKTAGNAPGVTPGTWVQSVSYTQLTQPTTPYV